MIQDSQSSVPCIVVNANNPMAFAVIRSLGKRNIPVIAAMAKTQKHKNIFSLIKVSSFVNQKFYFDETDYEKNLLKCLTRIHQKLKRKSALIPVDDDAMFMVSKHRKTLEPFFYFIFPPNHTINMILDKFTFYHHALKNNLPIPDTYFANSQKDIPLISKKIRYPCLIKPPWRQKSWYDHFGSQKVVTIHSPDDLQKQSHIVFQFQKSFVVQEEVSGNDKNILCSFTILDQQSNPLCFFICRKVRQYPPYKGDTSMAESCYDAEIETITLDVCKKLKLVGYISIEFKKDLRDHSFKIIEITPARINRQSGLATVSGIDIPWIWYQAVLGKSFTTKKRYQMGIHWISEPNELRSIHTYLKNRDLSIRNLFNSYRSVRGFEVFEKTDLLPFLIFLFQFVSQFFSLTSKLLLYPFKRRRI